MELNSKGQYRGSPGKDTESGCLVFTSSSKRKIGHFDVVVMQRRQRNEEKKRYARAILSLFCQSKPIAFLPYSLVKLLNVLYASPTSVFIRWMK